VVSVTNGLSGMTEAALGERGGQKTGGVNVRAKKEPCERDPLRELHEAQHETRLSNAKGSPPDLMLIT
jgi:hypothetical protein